MITQKTEYKSCTIAYNGIKYSLVSNGVRDVVSRANNVYEAAALIVVCQHNGKAYKRSMPDMAAECHMSVALLRKVLTSLIERKLISRHEVITANGKRAYEHRPLINVNDRTKFFIPRWLLDQSVDWQSSRSSTTSAVWTTKDNKQSMKTYIKKTKLNAFNLVLLLLVIDYKGYKDVNRIKEIAQLMKSSELSGAAPVSTCTLRKNFNAFIRELTVAQGHASNNCRILNPHIAYLQIKKMWEERAPIINNWAALDKQVAEAPNFEADYIRCFDN